MYQTLPSQWSVSVNLFSWPFERLLCTSCSWNLSICTINKKTDWFIVCCLIAVFFCILYSLHLSCLCVEKFRVNRSKQTKSAKTVFVWGTVGHAPDAARWFETVLKFKKCTYAISFLDLNKVGSSAYRFLILRMFLSGKYLGRLHFGLHRYTHRPLY